MRGGLSLGTRFELSGTCVVSGPDPDGDLDAIEAWEARVYAHEIDLYGDMSDTSSGSGPDRNDHYYRDL